MQRPSKKLCVAPHYAQLHLITCRHQCLQAHNGLQAKHGSATCFLKLVAGGWWGWPLARKIVAGGRKPRVARTLALDSGCDTVPCAEDRTIQSNISRLAKYLLPGYVIFLWLIVATSHSTPRRLELDCCDIAQHPTQARAQTGFLAIALYRCSTDTTCRSPDHDSSSFPSAYR